MEMVHLMFIEKQQVLVLLARLYMVLLWVYLGIQGRMLYKFVQSASSKQRQKNPYRHLQDHLARNHFKDRIAADLPTKKPYICPMPGCDGKHYPDWQAVMRHYIGKKHGILDKFVKEELALARHTRPELQLQQ